MTQVDALMRKCAKNGDSEKMRKLLRAGARVDSTAASYLYIATTHGHENCMRLLIEHGSSASKCRSACPEAKREILDRMLRERSQRAFKQCCREALGSAPPPSRLVGFPLLMMQTIFSYL